MTAPRVPNTFIDAMTRNNPAWTQLLGLCPLLAVSNSVANALGLALASGFVLLGSAIMVASTRAWVAPHLRLPAYVMIIATFTTCAVALLQAFAFDLYERIALFVQIIVTNCMILGRAESFASRTSPWRASLDALGSACGFALAIIALGAARELFGAGTIFAGTQELLGPWGSADGVRLLPEQFALTILRTPPGAFITAALLLGLGQGVVGRLSRQATHEEQHQADRSRPENL